MEKLLTVEQAAAYLQCPASTIRRYINSGELKAGKVGKGYRIRENEILKFVKAREHENSISIRYQKI